MSQVNLNAQIFFIYESSPNSSPNDNGLFTSINTTYIKNELDDSNLSLTFSTGNTGPKVPSINKSFTTSGSSGVYPRSFISTTYQASYSGTNPVNVLSSFSPLGTVDGSNVLISINPAPLNNQNPKGYTIFEIYEYITQLLDKFNNGMSYVKRCKMYTDLNTSLLQATNTGVASPQLINGLGRYTNYDTSCDMFSNTVPANVSSTYMNKRSENVPYFTTMPGTNLNPVVPVVLNTGGATNGGTNNTYANNTMSGIPNWKVGGVTRYPTLSASSDNANIPIDTTRPLLQQLADLINLTQNYEKILEKYKGGPGNGQFNYVIDTSGINRYLNDPNFSYGGELIPLRQSVSDLRLDLDRKVAEILADQTSTVYQSQLLKDSAIYTNLMWTILATSLIYYVFIKL